MGDFFQILWPSHNVLTLKKNLDYKPCMKVEGGVGEVKLEILAATPIAETPG